MPALPVIEGWEWYHDKATRKWSLRQTTGKMADLVARLTLAEETRAARLSISGSTTASTPPPASPASQHSSTVPAARPVSVQNPTPPPAYVPIAQATANAGFPQPAGRNGLPPVLVPAYRPVSSIQQLPEASELDSLRSPVELHALPATRVARRPVSTSISSQVTIPMIPPQELSARADTPVHLHRTSEHHIQHYHNGVLVGLTPVTSVPNLTQVSQPIIAELPATEAEVHVEIQSASSAAMTSPVPSTSQQDIAPSGPGTVSSPAASVASVAQGSNAEQKVPTQASPISHEHAPPAQIAVSPGASLPQTSTQPAPAHIQTPSPLPPHEPSAQITPATSPTVQTQTHAQVVPPVYTSHDPEQQMLNMGMHVSPLNVQHAASAASMQQHTTLPPIQIKPQLRPSLDLNISINPPAPAPAAGPQPVSAPSNSSQAAGTSQSTTTPVTSPHSAATTASTPGYIPIQPGMKFDPNTGRPLSVIPPQSPSSTTSPVPPSTTSAAPTSTTSPVPTSTTSSAPPPLTHVNTSPAIPTVGATASSASVSTVASQPPLTHTVSAPQVLQTPAKNSFSSNAAKWVTNNPKLTMAGAAAVQVGGLALGVDVLRDARQAVAGFSTIKMLQKKAANAHAQNTGAVPARPPVQAQASPSVVPTQTQASPTPGAASTMNDAAQVMGVISDAHGIATGIGGAAQHTQRPQHASHAPSQHAQTHQTPHTSQIPVQTQAAQLNQQQQQLNAQISQQQQQFAAHLQQQQQLQIQHQQQQLHQQILANQHHYQQQQQSWSQDQLQQYQQQQQQAMSQSQQLNQQYFQLQQQQMAMYTQPQVVVQGSDGQYYMQSSTADSSTFDNTTNYAFDTSTMTSTDTTQSSTLDASYMTQSSTMPTCTGGTDTYIDQSTTVVTDGNTAVFEQTTTEVDINADGSMDTFVDTDIDVVDFGDC